MTKSVRCLYPELAPLLLLMVALTVPRAYALDVEDARFHGFISQRLTTTTGNNNFFGDTSGELSVDYTEIGAGASWRPLPHWLLSGQAIMRRGGKSEGNGIEADYLYVAYTPLESETGHLSAKLGKIKVPYGLYNDLRDTPMTRPGILAPQSIYLDSLRQLNQAANGVHVEAERMLGEEMVTLRLSQIRPNVCSENTYWSFLGDRTLFPGNLESNDHEAFAGQLAFERAGGKARVMLSYAQGIVHYQTASTDDPWREGELDFKFTALSLQWNGERLSLSGERARNAFHSRFDGVLPVWSIDHRDIGYSWYLQGQWRFAPRWEALLRYDVNAIDQNDPDGEGYAAMNPGQAAWARYAKDWTLGLRYRLDRHWQFAGELHRIEGTNWLPPADNLTNGRWNASNASRNWNLIMFQATYQF